MEDDKLFLLKLLSFAHWATLGAGIAAVIACVSSFLAESYVESVLYFFGVVLLLSATTFLRWKRTQLQKNELRAD